MPESRVIGPESATVLAAWAGLAGGTAEPQELAALFQAFRERAQRIYTVDVSRFEFDFLRSAE